MSLTGTDYRRYDSRRVCDICGHLWHKSELTRIAPFRWACPDDVKGLTAEDISRHNASVRPLMVKAVKNAKGLSQTPTYQQAEGVVLNAVLNLAPNAIFISESGSPGGAVDSVTGFSDLTRSAGWMAMYLGDLILENRRPTRWITAATAKLVSMADNMIACQYLQSGNTFVAGYGAIYVTPSLPSSGTITIDIIGNAACLMALLRAYQVTGSTKYLIAARRAAKCLRSAQCVGLWSSFQALATGGGRFQPGPFPDKIRISLDDPGSGVRGLGASPITPYVFSPPGIVCAWAFKRLQGIDGDTTVGDGTDPATFQLSQDTTTTLSAAISACVTWWESGARDGTGDVVVGFGPNTPKDSYLVSTGGSSTWATNTGIDGGTVIAGYDYALGLRGLFEVGGYTDHVSSVYTWLRGFSANALNAAPTDRERREKSTLGTYDPTLALARYLRAEALTEAVDVSVGGSQRAPGYDWRTAGVLAPIQSSVNSSELRSAKDALSMPRHRRWTLRIRNGVATANDVSTAAYDRVDLNDDLRLLTFSGLSLQTSVGLARPGWSGGLTHYQDLAGASQAADVYRYAPQAFPLEQG